MLKPFDAERLRETLDRFRERARPATDGRPRPQELIAVRDGAQILILRTEELDWMESESNYVRLHVGKKTYLARTTLRSLEDSLDSQSFARVHRTAIVNANRILRLIPWNHGDMRITLRDGTEINLSRRYKDRLNRIVKDLGSRVR